MGKDSAARLEESMRIMRAVASLGLGGAPEASELRKILNEFVRDGVTSSGVLKFPGTHRKLEYILTTRPHVESSAALRYDKDV